MPPTLVYFGAIFFSGLAFVPAAAHAMELPNKINLSKEEYLIAQKLYRGWLLVAPMVVLALISTGLLAVQTQGTGPVPTAASVLAFLCVTATQVVFWVFTFPVNRTTRDWTVAPSNWTELRRRWEYSHAASAGLNLLAFAAAVLAVVWS
jgi:hypothetical protein